MYCDIFCCTNIYVTNYIRLLGLLSLFLLFLFFLLRRFPLSQHVFGTCVAQMSGILTCAIVKIQKNYHNCISNFS